MVQGYLTSHCPGTGRRTSGAGCGKESVSFCIIGSNHPAVPSGENHDRYLYEQSNTQTVKLCNNIHLPG